MALPHLPASYTTRKNIYEAAIVNRRTKVNDFHEKWGQHANYFQRNNIEATKKKVWESNESFQHSMDAYKTSGEREMKALVLKKRRLDLAKLLQEEAELYSAELKGFSRGNFSRLEEMKEKSEGLRSAREEKRQRAADELLYEHWRTNSPDIRKLELEKHQQHVIKGWGHQVDELQEKMRQEQEEKDEMDRQMEADRMAALELERQIEQEKLDEEKQLRDVLKSQVEELKSREKEAKYLKQQEDMLMKEQWEVGKLDERQKAMEKERKKLEFGKTLLRQHATALKRRSRQIQEELEEDRKFLLMLVEQEQQDQDIKTARREKVKADASWMSEVVSEQLKLEKAREAELDMLYQDEAARVWEQREQEWAKERAARERLMREVLEERKDQIVGKMEQVRLQQEESLERREELLRELEIAQQLSHREEEEKEVAKEVRKQELESQMTSRKERDQLAAARFQEELEDERMAESDYDKMLRLEAQRLNLDSFEPKPHGRKQAWM